MHLFIDYFLAGGGTGRKKRVKYPSVLSSSSKVLFFLALSVVRFFLVLSRDFASGLLAPLSS